nr:copper transporter 6-like [Ipomoea batatas]
MAASSLFGKNSGACLSPCPKSTLYKTDSLTADSSLRSEFGFKTQELETFIIPMMHTLIQLPILQTFPVKNSEIQSFFLDTSFILCSLEIHGQIRHVFHKLIAFADNTPYLEILGSFQLDQMCIHSMHSHFMALVDTRIPPIPDMNSHPESQCLSLNYWLSYAMRFLPGWPEFEAPGSYWLSLSLLFLLAFSAEFCSLMSSIKKQEMGLKSLLYDAGVHALRVFMAYLVIISIITTDFSFFLAAIMALPSFTSGLWTKR